MTSEDLRDHTVVVVDNHDSFVHTLIGYLHELGARTRLVEADRLAEPSARRRALSGAEGILISPGPGAPAQVAAAGPAGEAADRRIPVLGVCLGHQVVAEAYGAVVAEAPELFHGVTSPIRHDGSVLFEGIPSPFMANRYHSLAVDPETLPDAVTVSALTDTGVVMGIAHRDAPVWGVQFHPESVLTEGGYRLLANWLALTGLGGAVERSLALHPHMQTSR